MSILFPLVRPVLFQMDPERAHYIALNYLAWMHSVGLVRSHAVDSPVEFLDMKFPNAVGLAAGFDKNADYIDALGALGFGHVEVGTVTPRPQAGNPKPRLFRLKDENAVINRMGFNNKGVDHLVTQIKQSKFSGIRGINIGKNFDTPLEEAHADYLICFEKVYAHADYIAVNVSSPNTEGLRSLQGSQELAQILEPLLNSREQKIASGSKRVPLLVKVAPDLSEQQIEVIAHTLTSLGIDGLVATNTTVSRDGVKGSAYADEKGGLSGAPLHSKSLAVIKAFRRQLGPAFPIIGVGGISCQETARGAFDAGADILQLYTSFVYRGPRVITEVAGAVKTSECDQATRAATAATQEL